jgi:ABC-type polysaccharide/polyol phosphate export permease
MTTAAGGATPTTSDVSWRTWHGYAPLDAPLPARAAAAGGDVLEGVRRWRLWTYLAAESVKNQYRRTTIGPWWLTLQTFAFVLGLAVLFGSIFHQPQHDFLPYVACGFIAFSLLSGLTRAASQVFVESAGSIVSNRQPLSALVLQAVATETLTFLHNLVIIAGLAVFGYLSLDARTLLVVPAVALILVNGVALGLWLGPMVARFRDVGPLVVSILQMLMFFTPVFWDVHSLTDKARTALLVWNPFAYLLQSFRGPLIGDVTLGSFVGAVVVTLINIALAVAVFTRARSRIPYWVS